MLNLFYSSLCNALLPMLPESSILGITQLYMLCITESFIAIAKTLVTTNRWYGRHFHSRNNLGMYFFSGSCRGMSGLRFLAECDVQQYFWNNLDHHSVFHPSICSHLLLWKNFVDINKTG